MFEKFSLCEKFVIYVNFNIFVFFYKNEYLINLIVIYKQNFNIQHNNCNFMNK